MNLPEHMKVVCRNTGRYPSRKAVGNPLPEEPFYTACLALMEKYGVATVVRRTKSNYSAPADADIMEEAKQWHALVAGVGD